MINIGKNSKACISH